MQDPVQYGDAIKMTIEPKSLAHPSLKTRDAK